MRKLIQRIRDWWSPPPPAPSEVRADLSDELGRMLFRLGYLIESTTYGESGPLGGVSDQLTISRDGRRFFLRVYAQGVYRGTDEWRNQ